MENSKDEDAPAEGGSPPPPSFTGRLKLKDFMFQADDPGGAGLRRSPRISTPSISISSTSPPANIPDSLSPAGQPRTATGRTGRSQKGSNSRSPLISSFFSPKRKRPLPITENNDEAVSSPSPTKRHKLGTSKIPSSYAPPSKYAHLPPLPDAICPDLIVLFIGLNPGIQTARTGHAYAHPTNLFWRLLYSSGVTPRLCSPTEDRQMPSLYQIGNTNIVARPSRNGAELSKAEMDDGVEILEEKVRTYRPESVCIVGKSIWESLWRVRHGRGIKSSEFHYGWQDEWENMGVIRNGGDERWKGARVFVASSTSGLAATLKPAEKEAIWRQLGGWVELRRKERKEGKPATPPGVVE